MASQARLLAWASAMAPRIGERMAEQSVVMPMPQPQAVSPASPVSTAPCRYSTSTVM